MRFEALPNHDTDPAAAFASLTGAPAPAMPAPTMPAPAAAQPTAAALTPQQLTAIQPTLGGVMIEYAHRMSEMWFAAQAANWEFADIELEGMHDVQKVAETTDPDHAASLRAFGSSSLDPLGDAIDGKDIAQFRAAYSAAIAGCNSCHAATRDPDHPQGHGFIRIQVPTNTLDSIVAFGPMGATVTSAAGLEVRNPSPGDTIHTGAYAISGAAALGIDHVDIFLDNRDAGGLSLGSASVGSNSQWHAIVSIPNNQTGLHTLYFYGHPAGLSRETVVTVPTTVAR
jgi:hypothetical protein